MTVKTSAKIGAKKILDSVIEMFAPKSVLDVGCGTGRSLDCFLRRGINAVGIEGSKFAISKANNKENIIQFNLNEELNLNKKFSLIWCFEFVEHIHPHYVHNLLKTFSNHSNQVVVSAALPGQGGEGHFNEQPPEYWIKQFDKYNYKIDVEKTSQLRAIDEKFSKNMMAFVRSHDEFNI